MSVIIEGVNESWDAESIHIVRIITSVIDPTDDDGESI